MVAKDDIEQKVEEDEVAIYDGSLNNYLETIGFLNESMNLDLR